jgi:hypothetical protein
MVGSLVVAATAFAAAIYMLRFLIALLQEAAPSVFGWIVSVRPETGRYADDDFDATECSHGVRCPELFVENKGHAQEVYVPGLIRLDVHPVSTSLGQRSIRKGIDVLRERRT